MYTSGHVWLWQKCIQVTGRSGSRLWWASFYPQLPLLWDNVRSKQCSKDRFLHNECDENRGCSHHRLRLTPSWQAIQVDTSISLYTMKVRPLDNGFKSVRYCFHWAFIIISTEKLKAQWLRSLERVHAFDHWLLPSSVLNFCYFPWFTLASATQPLSKLSLYIYIFFLVWKNCWRP